MKRTMISYFNKEHSQKVWTIGQLQLLLYIFNKNMSLRTLYRKINELEELGIIEKIRGGIYINNVQPLGIMPEDIVEDIRYNAVVSLQRILGKYGVLNNGTENMTCVVPMLKDKRFSNNNYKDIVGKINMSFHGIPEKYHYCKELDENLVLDKSKKYPCATVDKAFCDMLYLGNSKKSKIGLPPYDSCLEDLDMKKVERIASFMQITEVLNKWLLEKEKYDSDENVANNMSVKFGM